MRSYVKEEQTVGEWKGQRGAGSETIIIFNSREKARLGDNSVMEGEKVTQPGKGQ